MLKIQTADLPDRHSFLAYAGEFQIRALARSSNEVGWQKSGTRVYGALDNLAPELMALQPYTGDDYYAIPKASPSRSDADNVRAAIWQAWKQQTTTLASQRLLELLVNAFKEPGHEPRFQLPGKRPEFSAKAGCPCGCSPGFVLDVVVRDALGTPVDLYVESEPSDDH